MRNSKRRPRVVFGSLLTEKRKGRDGEEYEVWVYRHFDSQNSQDVMGNWIEECALLGVNCRGRSQELHKSWVRWCGENEHYKTSLKQFLSALLERPNIRKVHTNMGNLIEGIDLNGHE